MKPNGFAKAKKPNGFFENPKKPIMIMIVIVELIMKMKMKMKLILTVELTVELIVELIMRMRSASKKLRSTSPRGLRPVSDDKKSF